MSHPQTGSKRQSHRPRSTAYTAYPRQTPNITIPCRNAATSPQTLQQSPTAHSYSSPTGPYAPNRTKPASGVLTVCTGSRSLRAGRVPGQPGLARPPASQEHNPEDDTPNPRAPTTQIRLARHPQDRPSKVRATRTTRNSFRSKCRNPNPDTPTPACANTRPGQQTKGLQTLSSF